MRKLFIGTKKFGERNVKDFAYVLIEETNQIWYTNLESGWCSLMVNRTIEDIRDQFDKWTDLGEVPDGVRISEIVKIDNRIVLVQ